MKHQTRNRTQESYDEAVFRAASNVRRKYHDLLGIFVHGSVARGEPGPFSDIDMVALTSRMKKPSDFSYFDDDIYVGVGFLSLREMKKEFTDPKAFFWARGSARATRVLYDPKGIVQKIMLRWKKTKLSFQIREAALWDAYHNIVEYSGKLRNGWLKHDEYLTRYSARIIAEHVERAIIALNDISIVSENYVWHQVLKAKRRPKHLKTDYPLASGLVGTTDADRIYWTALRLCRETLRLIKHDFVNKVKRSQFRSLLAVPLQKHGL